MGIFIATANLVVRYLNAKIRAQNAVIIAKNNAINTVLSEKDQYVVDTGQRTTTQKIGEYNNHLAYGIKKRIVQGKIGRVGYIKYEVGTVSEQVSTIDFNNNVVNTTEDREYIRTSKQINATTYVEMTMYDLVSVVSIDAKTEDGKQMYGVNTEKFESARHGGDENFVVPASYAIIKRLNTLDLDEYTNTFAFLKIYAAQVEHVEWYATGAFKSLMQIAAVVLSVFTFGYSLVVYGIAMTLLVLVLGTLIMKLIMYAIKEVFGDDNILAQVLVLVVAIVILWYTGDATYTMEAGSVTMQTATATLMTIFQMVVQTVELIAYSESVNVQAQLDINMELDGVNQEIMASAIQSLEGDMDVFNSKYKDFEYDYLNVNLQTVIDTFTHKNREYSREFEKVIESIATMPVEEMYAIAGGAVLYDDKYASMYYDMELSINQSLKLPSTTVA